MSNKITDNGGPAYPASNDVGLTKRDWFAGMALQGMMSRDCFDSGQATPEQRSTLAYIEADAMLEARKK